jgi:ketosteroid isomerase-like protein
MMASVEDRLRLLEDKEAIRTVLIDYGRALDSRDTQAYSDLFAADGEWSGGIGQARTPAGIKKMLDDLFAGSRNGGGFSKAHHVMANMAISVDGDTATAVSRWIWLTGDTNGSPVVMRAGYYDDAFTRENGSWKIQSRRAVTELTKAG